jgi:hypothetical protein
VYATTYDAHFGEERDHIPFCMEKALGARRNRGTVKVRPELRDPSSSDHVIAWPTFAHTPTHRSPPRVPPMIQMTPRGRLLARTCLPTQLRWNYCYKSEHLLFCCRFEADALRGDFGSRLSAKVQREPTWIARGV